MDKAQFPKLAALSQSAYQWELERQFDKAYKLHEEAIRGWKEFEKNGSFFSTDEREYKRIANKKVGLHNERLEVLKPYLNGEPIPAEFTFLPTAVTVSENLAPKGNDESQIKL